MKKQIAELHNEMLYDIKRCQHLPLSETDRAENCFRIAGNYWKFVQQYYREHEFVNVAEEIDFFRNVKPGFTSYVEYFVILYEALAFAPDDSRQLALFWQEESKRYPRFLSRNEDFIRYYKSGSHCYDKRYFLRNTLNGLDNSVKRIYDSDLFFCSSHDHLIASLFANKMFYEFTNIKTEEFRDQLMSSG